MSSVSHSYRFLFRAGVPDAGLPHIPSPPRSGGVTPQGGPPGGGGNDDVDLDDLTRRFEELKKRK